jgi:hypothetical protein
MLRVTTIYRLILLVLLVGASVTCTSPSATGQVSGAITVGPTCPGSICADRPVSGIVVHFMGPGSSSSEVASGTTNSRGRYSVQLPAGDYSVQLSGVNPMDPEVGTLGAAGPRTVHVTTSQTTTANYQLRSGIL